jgi:oxygen-independent coproporphyrinogen-3 oxidase
MQAHSLYLHIPFCHHRCSYCDFNTYSGMESLIPEYVRGVCQEIRYIARSSPQIIPIQTIFFGGGTPSILPIGEIECIFTAIEQEFELIEGLEISLEANPGRLSIEYLKSLRDLGVNRISLGMQSANPQDLLLLERQHDFQHVVSAVKMLRMAGIDNINLDLIYGLPYQSLDSWQRTLDSGISLNPDHLSLYALTIESGTPMGSWVKKGLLSEPDADIAADMYEYAGARVATQGYEQYEISNWARRDSGRQLMTCEHNLQYWRNLPYLGCGAGAHGFAGGMRTENELNPQKYVQALAVSVEASSRDKYKFPQNPAIKNSTVITRDREMKETMLMGLRLTKEGVTRASYRDRFGVDLKDEFKGEIEPLINSGLLEWDHSEGDRLRLTPRGYLLGNQVFMQFV